MSYDRLSITGTQLIIVLFCFPHSKSRRVQNSTVCMHHMLSNIWDWPLRNLQPVGRQTMLWPKSPKKTAQNHGIAAEKCFPMVYHMSTFALRKITKPWSLQQHIATELTMGLFRFSCKLNFLHAKSDLLVIVVITMIADVIMIIVIIVIVIKFWVSNSRLPSC